MNLFNDVFWNSLVKSDVSAACLTWPLFDTFTLILEFLKGILLNNSFDLNAAAWSNYSINALVLFWNIIFILIMLPTHENMLNNSVQFVSIGTLLKIITGDLSVE